MQRRILISLALLALIVTLWVVVRSTSTQSHAAELPLELGTDTDSAPSAADLLPTDSVRPAVAENTEMRRDASPTPSVEWDGVLRLTGRVVRHDGESVPSSDIRTWRVRERVGALPEYTEVTARARKEKGGRFRIPIEEAGTYCVWAGAHEECSSELVTVQLSAEHPEVDIELLLPEPAWISGHVWSANSEPLADVMVRAYVDIEGSRNDLPPGLTTIARWGAPRAKTREDGAFWIYPVHPNAAEYVVEIEPGEFNNLPASPNQSVSLEPRAPFGERTGVRPKADSCDIIAHSDAETMTTLLAHLLREDGGPAEGRVRFTLTHIDDSGSEFNRRRGSNMVGEGGLLKINGLRPGSRFRISAGHQRLSTLQAVTEFRASPGFHDLQLTLPRTTPVRVTVRNVGLEGQRAIVELRPTSNGAEWGRIFAQETCEIGETVVFEVPPGNYSMRGSTRGKRTEWRRFEVLDVPVEVALDLE